MKRGRPEAVFVPDGGWGWVIVACSFLIHMFVVGTLYALSVLYVSWLEAFSSGKGVTSWIISMAVAVMFGIGPLPGSLSRRFGNRPVVMVGGIMMAVGFFISAFATNVYFLIFTVGILAGVGAGCCYLPSVALVAQYFTSKRSLAMGISASGLGVGAFFMAPFLNWLVEYFGWRGTMQILSGIALNMCVLASLMRPLELAPHCRNCKWIEESELVSEQHDVLLATTTEGNGHGESETDEKKADKNFVKNVGLLRREKRHLFCSCGRPNQRAVRMFDANRRMTPINYFPSPALIQNHYVVLNPNYKFNAKHCVSLRHVVLKEQETIPVKAYSVDDMNTKAVPLPKPAECSCSLETKTTLRLPIGGSLNDLGPRPLNNLQRSLTFSHIPSPLVKTIEDIPCDEYYTPLAPAADSNERYDCALSVASADIDQGMDNNFVAAGQESEIHDTEKDNRQLDKSRSVFFGGKQLFCCTLQYLKSVKVYIKLMHSGIFMVFCISNFLTNLSFLMPVLYMVDRAVDAGIGKSEAAIFVSVYGTGNIFGKVFFGWLSDRKLMDRMLYYIGCLTMCGIATCLSPLCGSSHTLHSLYAFCFGCFIGAYCTLFPLVTVDLVGLSVVEESFGMLLCFMGIATAFGTPVAGWIFDFTGSYTWAFVLHGAFIIISALMLIPVMLKKRRVRK